MKTYAPKDVPSHPQAAASCLRPAAPQGRALGMWPAAWRRSRREPHPSLPARCAAGGSRGAPPPAPHCPATQVD
eukprot:253092-Chlamydomonas_euryale.AAC.3